MYKRIREFDETVFDQVTNLPLFVRPIMLFFTTIGQPVLTAGSSAVVVGFGLGQDNDLLIFTGLTALLTLLLAGLFKLILRRKRPSTDYASKRLFFDTFSFPSGHSTGAVACYGLLCMLLVKYYFDYMSIAAIVAIFIGIVLVGISRIYLGAHYASDVIGGWILGCAGLAVIAVVMFG